MIRQNLQIVLLLWLTSGVLQAQSAKLASHDWLSVDGKHYLAFRPMEKDSGGVAWYITTEEKVKAFSGKYEVFGNGNVSLKLTRCWLPVTFGEHEHWKGDEDYSMRRDIKERLNSVMLELDWNGGRFVATAVSGEWIDIEGDRLGGLDQWNRGRHIPVGSVLDMQPADQFPVNTLPPGFVLLVDWKGNAKENPSGIYGTLHLRRDLYGWMTDRWNPKLTYCLLQLQEGENWSSGTGWLISASRSKDASVSYQAHKGFYQIFANNLSGHDTLLLRFAATRSYDGFEKSDRIQWQLNLRAEKAAFLSELPLTDHAVPVPLTAVVHSLDHVDDQGKVIAKRERFGFFSLPERVYPHRVGPVGQSTTFLLKPGQLFGGYGEFGSFEGRVVSELQSTPPPGFRFRGTPADAIGREHSVARPAGSERQRQADAAAEAYRAVLKRVQEHQKDGDYAAMVRAYDEFLRKYPDHAGGHNSLAWGLATCPDSRVRDGQRAFRLAVKACELTSYKEAYIIDTLAAAYAEAGDFEQAVKWQRKALSLAPEDQKSEYEDHLNLFLRKQPVREK